MKGWSAVSLVDDQRYHCCCNPCCLGAGRVYAPDSPLSLCRLAHPCSRLCPTVASWASSTTSRYPTTYLPHNAGMSLSNPFVTPMERTSAVHPGSEEQEQDKQAQGKQRRQGGGSIWNQWMTTTGQSLFLTPNPHHSQADAVLLACMTSRLVRPTSPGRYARGEGGEAAAAGRAAQTREGALCALVEAVGGSIEQCVAI